MNLHRHLLFCLLALTIINISTIPARAGKFPPDPGQLKFPPLTFQIPQTEKLRLANGIPVHFLADSEFPMVTVSALIRAGAFNDPAGMEGLAELTGNLMRTGGTKKYSFNSLNETLDRTGSNLEVTAGREFTTISLSVLREHLEEGLSFFHEILANPLFDNDRFQVEKSLLRARIARISDIPDRLAFREFQKLLLRGTGRGNFPSPESLDKIEKKDVVDFHRKFFQPSTMALAVSGDISRDEALTILNRHLGVKDSSAPLARPIFPPVTRPFGERYLVNKQTPQSVIIVGWIAPPQGAEDFYPFLITDFLLGSGGFGSRVFSEVRSRRGLAYSAGSIYRARADHGLFMIYAMVDAQNTVATLDLLRDIINDFSQNPPSPQELRHAQNSINNAFIFSFDSSHEIARNYLQLELDSLPSDYFATYRDRLERVLPQEVQKTAKKYLPWEDATIMVLGPENKFGELWPKQGRFLQVNP